jgi:hypothetical protein
MPELPADFELKLMPDWLKEPAGKNPYADYEGRDEERRPRGRDDRGGRDDRRGRPPGGQRPGGPPRRDDRPRKEGDKRPEGKRPDPSGASRSAPPGASRPASPGGPRPSGGGSRPDDRRDRPQGPRQGAQEGGEHREAAAPPAEVSIEFFPDDGCAVSIAREIKSTHRAYSLFDLARMFLARPERHRLKITTKSVDKPLHQVGENGPVWLDRAAAERAAFPISKQKFYIEATEHREAPKGNFSNVARCRANGVLLGPTNYHGYQPALRRLFEERFSRRMSFPEFQREIEVVNDPALVEQWKQQASSSTIFRLKPPESAPQPKPEPAPASAATAEPAEVTEPAELTDAPEAEAQSETPAQEAPAEEAAAAEPTAPFYEGPVFTNLAEVEQHFRENYLPTLIRTASSFHLTGEASRALTDRGIASAVRLAWEQERGFPGQMMHQLRQHFSKAGLHVFKHRKRMQFVSLIRPAPMEDGSLSVSVAEILKLIQGSQNCTRASLAAAILGPDETAVDPARKTTLATDLRWLIETGRVIEFSDGRLDTPVVPQKPKETPQPEAAPTPTAETAPTAPAAEPVSPVPEPEITEAAAEAAEPVAEPEQPEPVTETLTETIAEPHASASAAAAVNLIAEPELPVPAAKPVPSPEPVAVSEPEGFTEP